ncbi:MAG TPA: hypothetical protein VJT83_05475, partial [Chitinophagaceae bacterium]|nr:hypothetical protein [Chitinophagaceae bacterium]
MRFANNIVRYIYLGYCVACLTIVSFIGVEESALFPLMKVFILIAFIDFLFALGSYVCFFELLILMGSFQWF